MLSKEENKTFVAIVDAYSTGNLLAAEFQKKGFQCIHVQSSNQMLPIFDGTFRPNDFEANIVHDGNLENTIEDIKRFNPSCIVVGIETGVILADLLSEKMGLIGNSTNKSEARRNKYLMHETIRSKNLKSIDHCKSNRIEVLRAWVNDNQTYPVVLKPLDGAGSDNINLCENDEQLELAFHSVLNATNSMGCVNEEVLVQKRIIGIQYVVNTVSCQGKHHVTDIWVSKRISANGSPFNYDVAELLPGRGKLQDQLKNYTFKVLDALELRVGPAHTEVFVTEDDIILIEVGARVCGGSVPSTTRACLGASQLDFTVDAFVDQESFFRRSTLDYECNKWSYIVALISYQEGKIRSIPGLSKIKELDSYYTDFLHVSPGGKIEKTIDLESSPGDIHLINDEMSVLEKDYEFIRKLEKKHLFELET